MKQLLALMSLFLVVLLGITTVMAVGSAKQSEMVVQRNQQVNSLRAELRTLKKEQEKLNNQLAAERSTAQTLRKEQDLLDRRIRRLLLLMNSHLPAKADIAAENAFASAVSPWSTGSTAARTGQTQLRVQALENAVSQLVAQSTSVWLQQDTQAEPVSELQTSTAPARETPVPESQIPQAQTAKAHETHQLPELYEVHGAYAIHQPPDTDMAPLSLFAGLPSATPASAESVPEAQPVTATPPPKTGRTAEQLAEFLSDRLKQVQNLFFWIGNCMKHLTDTLCQWHSAA